MIYTAITGRKDEERKDIKVFSDYSEFLNPRMNAKIYKVLSHLYIQEEISVWVDGNIYPIVPEDVLVRKLLGKADMAIFKHPTRTNIYQEAEVCKKLYLDPLTLIDEQIAYRPNIDGLYECGVIIRRHTEAVKRLNESWWAEICRYSSRDQLSFPYVLKRFPKIKLKIIEGNVRTHPYFKYIKHSK